MVGKLEKLKITPVSPSKLAERYRDGIAVQFNPNSLRITKPVVWTGTAGTDSKPNGSNRELDAPPQTFGGGGLRTLSMRLFYDVTEGGDPNADVRTETNKLVELTRIERKQNKPPVCLVSWGESVEGSDLPFTGVISNLAQEFVLFSRTGRPLRANLDVTFTEFIDPEQNKKQTDPDFTTYLVKLGDDLSAISAKVYRDPALWRVIADANRIDDPRTLTVGARLSIPKI